MRTRNFVKLPIMIFEDTRAIRAGEQAMHLWVSMWSRSFTMESDGCWEDVQVSRLNVPNWDKRLDALIEQKLVAQVSDGVFQLIDWLLYHESVKERGARLEKERERKRLAALQKEKKHSA